MSENNQNDEENQTYDAQVAELAAEMSEEDEMHDDLQEINLNDRAEATEEEKEHVDSTEATHLYLDRTPED
jgi:hypothetical protein